MRFKPYDYEYAALPQMHEAQRLEYFLHRIYETEEIWGLKEGGKYWMTYDHQGEETMPIFPYKVLAEELAVNDWDVMIPVTESLEYFIENTLGRLMQNNVVLELMPLKDTPGCLMTAQQLYHILDQMIDSGTYTMEG